MFFLSPTQAANFLPSAYNSFAEDFSQTRKNSWSEFEELLDPGAHISTDQNKKIIGDIGCGNARLYHFLAEKNISGKYIGIDVAENFLKIAEKKVENGYIRSLQSQFKKGDFLNLPLEKNSVDEIWAIASFHHLPTHKTRKQALKNIRESLREGGKIFLTAWNLWEQKKYIPQKKSAKIRSLLNPLFSDRDFLIPWGEKKTPRYYYSFAENYLRELLKEEGFEIEKFFYSDKRRNICIRAKKISVETKNFSPLQEKFYIKNIPFQKISFEQALETIIFWAQSEKTQLRKIYTPNPEMIVECQKNKKFKTILQNADLSLADGNGILWASGIKNLEGKIFLWKWILGIFSLFEYAFFRKNFPKEIEEPICGSDMFREFLERTKNIGYPESGRQIENNKKIKIYLLGGEPGSAKELLQKYPQIVGYFDGIANEKNLPSVYEEIKRFQANAIFIALGAPKQEKIIDTMAKSGEFSGIAMGVGGSFDFMTGHQTRAPKIFRKLGVEWLYRLIKQPNRAGRIWNATGKFIGAVLNNTII